MKRTFVRCPCSLSGYGDCRRYHVSQDCLMSKENGKGLGKSATVMTMNQWWIRIYRMLLCLFFGGMERCARELLGSSCEEAMESRGKPRPTEREGAALVAKLAGKLLINNTQLQLFHSLRLFWYNTDRNHNWRLHSQPFYGDKYSSLLKAVYWKSWE